MKSILDTGIKNAKNVDRYIFGAGSLGEINKLIHPMIDSQDDYCIFFVDEFFKRGINNFHFVYPFIP